ncbi:MAG: helix-turn-helix domain-containing protein [Thermomicrobiales bacterium]
MDDSTAEFGPRLTELRQARGWSQVKLAQEAGLDPSTVSRFEAGSRAPERETVLKIADALVLPVLDRERLLAAAGFRSEAWDDPMLAELAQIINDPAISAESLAELRTLLRIAILHGRRAREAGLH